MATIYPFRALRPRPDLANEVASVPYDVVNRDEARELARGNPRSFLHVTRPEIDMADDIDPHSDPVYEAGAAYLQKLIAEGALVHDPQPCLYVYGLTWQGHTQTGVVMLASVDEYDQNLVRKHEHTRPDKEKDRAHHIEVLGAQAGPVFLVHRDEATIAEGIAAATNESPVVDFTAVDGVRHRFWVVSEDSKIKTIVDGFVAAGPIYVADGHHRSAAASRVAAARKTENAGFLAVSFPVSEMRILPYNRVVRDLAGRSVEKFLAAVGEVVDLTAGKPEAIVPRQFGMYLAGKWHTLATRAGSFPAADPVAGLDVSILQNQLLAPLLGIEDPRRDQRIDFVGGIRGDDELERRVGSGWAVAFKLHATGIEQLLAIANAEGIMPPKSTWFEPKLRSGLFVHVL